METTSAIPKNSNRSFATSFWAGLRLLHARGKLHLSGDWAFLQNKASFDDWLKLLESITWVAYIEPPPFEYCPPEQMAKYLARYLTGVRFSIAGSCRMKSAS